MAMLSKHVGLCCVLAASLTWSVAATQIVANRTPDFLQDYAAAWAWRQGRTIDEPTTQLANEFWPSHGFVDVDWLRQPHPPAATMLALPFTYLDFVDARWIWSVTSAAFLAGAWRLANVPLSVCFAMAPLWCTTLILGTHEPLLALLIAAGAVSLNRRPRLAGLALGCAIAIKVYPVVLLAGLTRRRSWTTLTWALAATAVSFALGEVLFGIGSAQRWLAYTAGNTARFVDASQNGSLVRWLREIVAVAPIFGALIVLALLGTPTWLRRQAEKTNTDHDSASGRRLVLGWIPLMLLASPLSWRHYAGLAGLTSLSGLEQALFATAGGLALLGGMGALGDIPEAIIQTPLLGLLLWQWRRATFAG